MLFQGNTFFLLETHRPKPSTSIHIIVIIVIIHHHQLRHHHYDRPSLCCVISYHKLFDTGHGARPATLLCEVYARRWLRERHDHQPTSDICQYFKDQGNEFNLVGAPHPFVEACEKAFLIYEAWAHAVKHKMVGATTTSDHPDYEKDMFKWMQPNYPGSFDTYNEWDNAKSLYKNLTSIPCNADAPDGETLWDLFKAAGKLEFALCCFIVCHASGCHLI